MEDLVLKFIHHIEHERQLSKHTVLHYRKDIAAALNFFKNISVKPCNTWNQVDEESVRSWIVFERQKEKKARSLNRQLSALKTFYAYLIKLKKVDFDPTDNIKSLKTEKLLPKPLDVDQVAQLLNEEVNSFISIRDCAMIELIYSAGLRISELVSLNVNDIDFSSKQIRILGKGKKVRLGIIGGKAMEALKKWLMVRENLIKEGPLFLNQQGKRLTARAIQYRFTKIGILQGIDSAVHPHRLRHSFASHLLESSGNLRAVQELLGHQDLSSTQIYTALNFQHLAGVYDECHPRARKGDGNRRKAKES